MLPEIFAHNCPTINATAEVNHFAHPEFSRLGGFSAESVLRNFVRLDHTGDIRVQLIIGMLACNVYHSRV